MIKKNNFLAAMFFCLLFCGTVNAQSSGGTKPASESDFKVRLTSDGTGAVITRYIGNGGDVVIPDTIQGFPVKEIGGYAFEGLKNIVSVKILDSVEKISCGAFSKSSIKSVIISDSVKEIEDEAFYACKNLEHVEFPKNDELRIKPDAFSRCDSLTTVTFYSTECYLNRAFYYCKKLETVVFESGVKEFDIDYAFREVSLKDVVFKSPDTVISGSFGLAATELPLAKQAEIRKHTVGEGIR